jgi:hypothetical protein
MEHCQGKLPAEIATEYQAAPACRLLHAFVTLTSAEDLIRCGSQAKLLRRVSRDRRLTARSSFSLRFCSLLFGIWKDWEKWRFAQRSGAFAKVSELRSDAPG